MHFSTIAKLEQDLVKKKEHLLEGIPVHADTTRRDVTAFLEGRHGLVFTDTKCKHQTKFSKLVEAKHAKTTQKDHAETTPDKARWVINKSKHVLTSDDRSVLEKGLNFAVMLRGFPIKEVIVSTELACRHLSAATAQSLRANREVTKCVKKSKPPASNISKSEFQALQNLKKDDSITILPADKGRATVLLNTKDYEDKIDLLLSDTNTYEKLNRDPTATYKRELIDIIRKWQKEDPIPQPLKDRIHPTAEETPKMYGLPKIHKANDLLWLAEGALHTMLHVC